MGKEAELFKAAKSGNVTYLRRVFAPYLKKGSTAPLGGIRKSATPNIQDDNGYSLLHHATLNGQGEVVSLLLTCGASALISDCSGSYPLHLAAWKGDLEIVKLLVTQGPSYADVNQQSGSDDTPLHLAAIYGYSDVVEFLLQRHADPMIRNAKHETPLDLAAQYGHLDTVHLLVSCCPELLQTARHDVPTSPLHLAVRNGHTLVALSIINAGLSVNTLSERGSALHEAALSGKVDTVKLLLDKGIDIGLKDGKGRTVLQALEGIPGEKLKDIQKLITEYRDGIRHSCVENKIIAVARKNYSSVTKQPGLLAFKKGDCIMVEKKEDNGDVFVGTVNGRTGSFLAGDVEFYSVNDGSVQKTDNPLSSPSSAYLLVPPHGRQPQQEAVLTATSPSEEAECSPSPTSGVATSPGTGVVSPGPDGSEEVGVVGACPPERLPLVAPTAAGVQVPRQNIASILVRPVPGYDMVPIRDSNPPISSLDQSPVSPDPSLVSPDPILVPLPPDPNPEHRLKARMSKREKKLALRNDTGGYAELYPINPQEIKESSSAYEVTSVGVASPPVVDQQPIKASYCVLEINNFDGLQPSVDPCPVPTLRAPRIPRYEEVGGGRAQLVVSEENGLATVTQGGVTQGDAQKGYCMLEVKNFDEEGVGVGMGAREVRSTGAHSGPYQNVDLTIAAPKRGTNYVNVGPEVARVHCEAGRYSSADIEGGRGGRGGASEGGRGGRGGASEGERGGRGGASEGGQGGRGGVSEGGQGGRGGASEGGRGGRGGASSTPGRAPREMVYEVVELGRKGGGEAGGGGGVTSVGNAATEDSKGDSADNKGVFAGLVLSASRQMEEEVGAAGALCSSWDDEHVNEEWSKIDTLLSAVRRGAPSFTSPTLLSTAPSGSQTQISQWLDRIQMGPYAVRMVTSGFDQLQFLNGVVVTAEDLADIGITDSDHQLTIMAAISLLPIPPSLQHVTTLAEFLEMLQLSHLEPKFIGYSLEKVSKLLDLELSSVVGVEEIGYRRRLEYGIRELKSHHPEWNLKKLARVVSVTLPNTTFLQPTAGTMLRSPGDSSPSRLPRKPNKYSRNEVLSILNTSPIDANTEDVDGTVRRVGRERALVLRPPSQAIVSPDPFCSEDSWKHSNHTLIEKCVNYDAKYLGSVIMVTMRGTQSLEEACLRLKTSTESMQKIPDITLSISWKGVKFVDSHTNVVVSTHAIRDISYCSKDIEDKRVFGYVTKDRSGNYCHVFMASTTELSDEIVMTIGQAAEITYQKVMCARKHMPSEADHIDTEPHPR